MCLVQLLTKCSRHLIDGNSVSGKDSMNTLEKVRHSTANLNLSNAKCTDVNYSCSKLTCFSCSKWTKCKTM